MTHSRILAILLGLDLLASTLCGGRPGETLSGRAGTKALQGKTFWQSVINFVMRNPNHCQEAIKGDIARAQAVIDDDSKDVK